MIKRFEFKHKRTGKVSTIMAETAGKALQALTIYPWAPDGTPAYELIKETGA